ncbi:hypothetical protein FF1_034479 [Malus domestica]
MMRQYLKRRARGITWLTRLTEGARKKLNTNVRECKNIIVAHADAVKTSLNCMTFLKGTLCDCLQATAIVWNGKLEGFHVNICVHALYGSEPTQKTIVMNSSPKRNERYWVDDPYDVIYSPPLRKPHGRPTKNRRKEANERKNRGKRKRSYALSCKICGTLGHNRRRCPNGNLEMIQRGGVNLARGTRRASRGVDAPRKIVPNEGIQIGSTHVASQEIESQAPEPSQEIRSQANATNHVVDNQPF